ncbi:HDOD domain-containing protein [Stenotrophomonas sp. YIM B06876]|uniref:HDOD domain-containing protein n=1 Tax=Stenotrophomonas sp. YIM B06876 TaxID=3060211 RepID=UPI00273927E8|nr:HDOD domain-containing protein [Stenotrophomonas sp. YIM B06876]
MTTLIPVLAALVAALLVLVIFRVRHRRGRAVGVTATAWPVTAKAEAMDDAMCVDGEQAWRILQQAQRGFHALALGVPGTDAADEELDPPHRAVIAAVITALGRADLSPRYTPRRPQLLPQLIQSVNDTAASSRSISAIIGQDPVLAGNLLRIANSPLYRLQSRPVESIERAVTLVGTDGIRQIISAALVQPVMHAGGGDGSRFPVLIWEYSLRVSAAAADHARGVERDDGFAAQLAGLLHGLGAVVVMQAAHDEYARQPALAPSALALRELLERCTQPTAARIALHWELADVIHQALHDGDSPAAQDSALGRSLRFARTAAALAVLCAEQQMEDARALDLLAQLAPAHVAGWIWKRIRQPAA